VAGSHSALAAQKLLDRGFTEVKSLQGGFPDWLKAGFPLASSAAVKIKGKRVIIWGRLKID
jgi:3-mercaptopyruvate sulfurtransferase SseA